jgi:hypothetical protein
MMKNTLVLGWLTALVYVIVKALIGRETSFAAGLIDFIGLGIIYTILFMLFGKKRLS